MAHMIKKIFIGCLLVTAFPACVFADVIFRASATLKVSLHSEEQQVVQTAFDIFSRDYEKVFGGNVMKVGNAQMLIGTLGGNSIAEKIIDQKLINDLNQHQEGFVILVKEDKLYILGSDNAGTAYGILELSRLMGVSPWEWWADVPVVKRKTFVLKEGYKLFSYPSVKYRGVFLNDEDWGLQPWAAKTFEPETKDIGPKTYAKIFELLLRLRANLIWPAMHPSTKAFFHYPGNIQMAAKYGIYIGSSHAEPMLRNNVDEWNEKTMGRFNYITNKTQMNK